MKKSDAIAILDCYLQEDSFLTYKKEEIHKALKKAIKGIKEIKPSASWEYTFTNSDNWAYYRCTNCYQMVNSFEMKTFQFCPNCGAEIGGKDET